MKTRTISYAVAVIVMAASSCQKDGDYFLNANDPVAARYTTYTQQFYVVWSALNSGYCFWDITDVDWDQRYLEMKPKFENLDKKYSEDKATVDSLTFTSLYKELLSGLIDHHMTVQLKDPHNEALVIQVFPGQDEVSSRSYYHEMNVLELVAVIRDSYGDDMITGGMSLPDIPYALAVATKIHTADGKIIPYLWSLDFIPLATAEAYIKANKDSSDPAVIQNVADAKTWLHVFYEYIKWVAQTPEGELAGVILDVRNNIGGDPVCLSSYVGLFTSEGRICFETRYKEGMGRREMSAWTPTSILPYEKHRDMAAENLPVVVLADINSASCAEVATLFVQSLPTGFFIGERTWGAQGPIMSPSDYSFTYGGSVGDPNLLTMKHYVNISALESRPYGKSCLEGIGISPDTEVLYKDKGYKGQLQAALDLIGNWGRTSCSAH